MITGAAVSHVVGRVSLMDRSHGIRCEVLTQPGRHVWPFAAAAFADSLPWLASFDGRH